MHEHILDPRHTALLIIDMQEAFRPAISDFADKAANTALMAHAAQLLGLPIIFTEQYPKGLGRTATEIRAVLSAGIEPVEKTSFSACGAPEFDDRLTRTGAYHLLVSGVEAHVCVSQTVHDLIERGYRVHLLTDCITARAESNKQVALAKMQQAGALPSSIEMALFELLRRS